jgi:hypothetical protein
MQRCVLLTLCVGLFACPSVSAAEEGVPKRPKPVPRVRAADSRMAAALEEGLERSASFRAIVDRVNQLDVIVYIETQPLLRHRLAGRMTWVTATKDFRYVRVAINPDLQSTMLIASLAHELQHVIEVGEAPSIVDNRTLADHYRAHGLEKHVNSDEWDTEAARRTGETVRRELADPYNGRAAQSIPGRRAKGRN